MRVALAMLAWLSPLGSACDAGREAEQGRMLLTALKQLELDAPLSQRQQHIAHLQSVVLADDGLRATRQACVAAHGRLLESEVLQAEVKQGLSQPPSGPTDVDAARARLAQLLTRSEEARAQGEAALPTCRERTRELAKRFR